MTLERCATFTRSESAPSSRTWTISGDRPQLSVGEFRVSIRSPVTSADRPQIYGRFQSATRLVRVLIQGALNKPTYSGTKHTLVQEGSAATFDCTRQRLSRSYRLEYRRRNAQPQTLPPVG